MWRVKVMKTLIVSETYAFLNAGWGMFLNAREYFSTRKECFSTQRGVSQRGVVFRIKSKWIFIVWREILSQLQNKESLKFKRLTVF